MAIADDQAHSSSHIPVFDAVSAIDDTDWGWVAQHTTLNNWLPGNWMQHLTSSEAGSLALFAAQLLTYLSSLEDSGSDCLAISFIEVSLWLCNQEGFCLPDSCTQADASLRPLQLFFTRPILARVVCTVRAAMRLVDEAFDAGQICRGASGEHQISPGPSDPTGELARLRSCVSEPTESVRDNADVGNTKQLQKPIIGEL